MNSLLPLPDKKYSASTQITQQHQEKNWSFLEVGEDVVLDYLLVFRSWMEIITSS